MKELIERKKEKMVLSHAESVFCYSPCKFLLLDDGREDCLQCNVTSSEHQISTEVIIKIFHEISDFLNLN